MTAVGRLYLLTPQTQDDTSGVKWFDLYRAYPAANSTVGRSGPVGWRGWARPGPCRGEKGVPLSTPRLFLPRQAF